MDVDTKLLLICLIAIAGSFVFAVMRILGVWCEHHIQRHDLIVASKQKRREYFIALAERNKAEVEETVIIEEDSGEAPLEAAPLAQAA